MARVFCPVTDGRKEQQRAGSGAILSEFISCACTLHALRKLLALLVWIGKGDLESLDKTIHCDARGGRTGFGSLFPWIRGEESSLSLDQGCQFVSSKS